MQPIIYARYSRVLQNPAVLEEHLAALRTYVDNVGIKPVMLGVDGRTRRARGRRMS